MRLLPLLLGLMVGIAGCDSNAPLLPDGGPLDAGSSAQSETDLTDAQYVVELSGLRQPVVFGGDTELYHSAGIAQASYTTPETGRVQCDEVILHTISISVQDGQKSFSINVPGESLREGWFMTGRRQGANTATGCYNRDDIFNASYYDKANPSDVYPLRSGGGRGILHLKETEDGGFEGTFEGHFRYASIGGGPVVDETVLTGKASFRVDPGTPVQIIPGTVLGADD